MQGVWPTTASGWVLLIGGALSIMTVMSGLIGKWLDRRINAMGERLTVSINGVGSRVETVEKSCVSNATLIGENAKKLQTSEFDRASLHEDVGRLENGLAAHSEAINDLRETLHADQKQIIDRLARIESKVDVAQALDRFGENMVRAFSRRTNYRADKP